MFPKAISIARAAAAAAAAAAAFPALSAPAAWDSPAQPVRIAYVNSYGGDISSRDLSSTVGAIERAVAPHRVYVSEYTQQGLIRAAQNGGFDVAIASSGLTNQMLLKTNGLALLTMVSSRTPDPNHASGGVIVARSGDASVKDLRDLRGKKIAVVNQQAFAGWYIPAYELQKHGVPPAQIEKNLVTVGAPMTNVLEAVKDGRAEAGFVISCLLEELAESGKIDMKDFRVIGEKKHENFACAHSTDLYPGWFLSVQPSLTPALAKKVLAAALSVEPDRNGKQWMIAADRSEIDALSDQFELRGPKRTLGELIEQYWTWIFGSILAIILLLLYSSFLTRMVKKKNFALSASRLRWAHDRDLLRERMATIESLERVKAVGLMASMLGHELKQPLTVIQNFTEGLQMRLKRKGTVSAEDLEAGLAEIETAGVRATEIVDQVRDYVRGVRGKRVPMDLAECVSGVADLCRRQISAKGTEITLETGGEISVNADPVEMKIIFLNLIKNAAEAASSDPAPEGPRVRVTLRASSGVVTGSVSDNGPEVSEETFSRMNSLGKSSKANSLGLGLGITRQLIEEYGGSLNIARGTPRGIICTVTLPFATETDNDGSD